MESGQPMFVKDIKNGSKDISLTFIILEIGKPNKTKDGHEVRSFKVADKTGVINLSVWDQYGELLQTGDICRLVRGYASYFKGALTLYHGKQGYIIKVGEFNMIFSETPNMSEVNPEEQIKLEQNSKMKSNDNKNGNSQRPMLMAPNDPRNARMQGVLQNPVRGPGGGNVRLARPQMRDMKR
ncbi:DgyrCDS10427 [Dimorphilus gyrociliatus]|uniref:DgyrCDS10427 n=1 Tax=Dimorphilus gyrociliatus TaxID=2664684 RepID=A0A7I8W090_9ANNE|nr:DgyrCDS10427 [Dimorphilus gyrociliatus]